MPEEPTFAVVIPTYNRAQLVQRTLSSVFAQTHPAAEVIVVDNCSTDDTDERLAPLAEAGRITFVKHPRNLERAASRNTGMARATSDFVTLLDSDDLMYPTALADAARFVACHPEVRLFQNRYELIGEDGRRLHRFKFPSLRDPLRAIADGNFMSCIGNFLHRDIYSQFRFSTDAGLAGSEDWEFWLRVIAHVAPMRLDRVNSAIVQHGGRTVDDPDLAMARRRLFRVIEVIRDDPLLAERYREHFGRMEASAILLLATWANAAGRRDCARALLREARRHRRAIVASEKFWRIWRHTYLLR
jgi:glycosyltransferase involved in cell wall biosynthesis